MKHVGMPRSRWLPATAALLSLVACGPDDPEEQMQQPAVCNQETYDKAVLDAVEPTQSDVITDLFAINASNTRLKWNEDKSKVLMVVWTGFTGYTPGPFLQTRDVFVTAAPQLKEFCQSVTDDSARVARINQYLGLPPATEADNSRRVAEMWVKPADLFRPCPDGEIDDGTCGLMFPSTATADHKTWINNYYASSYGFWQTTRYPWTGLGYTYDWCSGGTSHVGASEYVIRKGSTVDVVGYTDRAAYCAK
jgi:hypothetical protein